MNSEGGQKSGLKPTLGLFDATAISVGAIIGAGIFVVTGIAADCAGSALIISMLIAAVTALFTALSFAELTAWMPKEGSVYEYAHQLISPFAGFLTGWMWIISNTFTGAAVSLGFAYYLTVFTPHIEAKWVAALLCLFFTVLNYFGVRQSALINNILVATKLAILAFFCIFGLLHINASNFTPFSPFQAGVLYGASYIFFAYGGFARVAVIAEEVKDAERNVPKAMLLSLLLSTTVYLLVGAVAVGLVGAKTLADSNSPLKDAIGITKSPIAEYLVSAGGLVATASVLLTSIMGVSRMAYAMARRKDLPQTLSKLHTKYNTPHYAIWIVGILMSLLVLSIDLTKVVAISTFALLFYYAIANISALKLKNTIRKYPKTLPAIGTTTCLLTLAFILFVSPQAWIIGITSLLVGATYYIIKQKLKVERVNGLIEHYDFGLIVINGKRFTSDLIVFPERVVDGWWRKEGHRLHIEDLKLILTSEPKPQVLVVGTGYNGLLRVSPEVENTLKAYGIELIVQPTREATQTFNKLLNSGKRVAGAFHLTC